MLQTCEPVEYASEASRVSTIKLTLMRDRREAVEPVLQPCEPVAVNASEASSALDRWDATVGSPFSA